MFYSTIDAIKFGLKASVFERKRMSRLREHYLRHYAAATKREQMNLAIMFATQAQFCREALEAEAMEKQLYIIKANKRGEPRHET